MRKIYFSALLLLFVACQDQQAGTVTADDSASASSGWNADIAFTNDDLSTPTELQAEVLLPGRRIGDPLKLCILDSHLLISDDTLIPAVWVIDRSSGTVVDSLGSRGQGPGEFRHVTEIIPLQDECFGVFDSQLRRLTRYCSSNGGSDAWTREAQITFSDLGANTTDIVQLNDGSFVLVGFFTDGRLALFDESGAFVRAIGPLPPGDEDTPISVRQHAYQSFLGHHEGTDRVVVSTRHADIIEVYSSEEGRLTMTQGPREFDPNYDWRMRGDVASMIQIPEMRFGYVNVDVGEDRIFALYSGQTQGEDAGLGYMGSEIYSFDIDGTPRGRFVTEDELISIEVDESNNYLYGVVRSPDINIVRYEIR